MAIGLDNGIYRKLYDMLGTSLDKVLNRHDFDSDVSAWLLYRASWMYRRVFADEKIRAGNCGIQADRSARKLVLPEPLKPIRRESCVTDSRVDRLVPKVVLDCTGVLAIVCELVAAGMAQHVAVNEEVEAGGLASPRDHALIPGNA